VLYRFQGSIGGGDGANPYGDLVSEGGTLYGTTTYGGSSMACSVTTSFGTVLGCGTVFSLNARNNVAIFSFTGGANGQSPQGGLLLNRSGAFFGTTAIGGVGTACSPPSSGGGGCGVAFELLPLPSNLAPAVRWATPRS
jgi:hypothetical protein